MDSINILSDVMTFKAYVFLFVLFVSLCFLERGRENNLKAAKRNKEDTSFISMTECLRRRAAFC